MQAAGEEQARKALQEKARKESEANEQLDELFRRATRLQPKPPPPCPLSWQGAEGEGGTTPAVEEEDDEEEEEEEEWC